ncbi:ogr/Delta-like zinc finger family protein [Klebsiella michiganensis]|uniref:ogr/Delta-like zinc finger family protein n=1 Tax=Klebsiella michiganensis TaxID=1134687 RepID=UPI0039790D9E
MYGRAQALCQPGETDRRLVPFAVTDALDVIQNIALIEYHQCQNINCSCTFMTMETIERFIVTPGAIDPAPPHPTVGGQRPLWL